MAQHGSNSPPTTRRGGSWTAAPKSWPACSSPTPTTRDELAEPATLDGDPVANTINHETQHERVQTCAALKPRERRDLFLHAAGYSYTEIADLTDSTYTAVNRRLTEGRRLLKP